MTNYSAQQGQTIYDICLQVYGTLDKLYQLIQDSNFSNVLTYPNSGKVFIFDPTQVKDFIFAQWLNNNKVTLNTGAPVSGGDFNSDFSSDFSGGG